MGPQFVISATRLSAPAPEHWTAVNVNTALKYLRLDLFLTIRVKIPGTC
jgi:hypothetical protein